MPFRTLPLARVAATVVTSAGEKFAIPTTIRPKVVRLMAGSDVFVGYGNATSVPAAATTNTVFQEGGTSEYLLDGATNPLYIYIYAIDGTSVEVVISFLG